jgi:uncharacterized protein (DUF2141 family)
MVLLILFGYFLAATAFDNNSAEVTVTVSGIEYPAAGPLVIMLYNSAEGFPRDPQLAAYRTTLPPSDKATVHHTFTGVVPATYAVAVFQDHNDNGEIDTNFLGIPKEPIGAYNMKKLGKPSFKKSQLEIPAGSSSVALQLLNQ